jgi:predicted dinucleotide-binding enzyme
MKTIAVIGTGAVGTTLADGFLKHGYAVVRGTREPAKLAEWHAAAGPHAKVATMAAAAHAASAVVLAVKGSGAEEAVHLIGPDHLAGKLVIDTTNPIASKPPKDGVLSFFTTLEGSLMERLQALAPAAHFVKAFSSVGNLLVVDPDLGGQRPTMYICGNDAGAKADTRAILTEFGWDSEDLGSAVAARAIEPLCILWCIPGMLRNDWRHTWKVLR